MCSYSVDFMWKWYFVEKLIEMSPENFWDNVVKIISPNYYTILLLIDVPMMMSLILQIIYQ